MDSSEIYRKLLDDARRDWFNGSDLPLCTIIMPVSPSVPTPISLEPEGVSVDFLELRLERRMDHIVGDTYFMVAQVATDSPFKASECPDEINWSRSVNLANLANR